MRENPLGLPITTPASTLTAPESLTITRIHLVAGEFDASEPLLHQRPFRSAHHSCSGAALLGGGHTPKPGDISLAHGGVLFLDELAEFPRRVLDLLRQPLEDGNMRISRSRETTVFPAAVTLLSGRHEPLPMWMAWRQHPSLSLYEGTTTALLATALRPSPRSD